MCWCEMWRNVENIQSADEKEYLGHMKIEKGSLIVGYIVKENLKTYQLLQEIHNYSSRSTANIVSNCFEIFRGFPYPWSIIDFAEGM